MKRQFLVAAFAALLTLSPASNVASAAIGDARPACADITGGAGRYTDNAGTTNPTLEFELGLGAASCRWATYSVFVYDSFSGGAFLGSQTIHGGTACSDPFSVSPNCVSFSLDLGASAPNSIYFYFTSNFGPRVVDRAPDLNRANRTLCTGASCPVGGEEFN